MPLRTSLSLSRRSPQQAGRMRPRRYSDKPTITFAPPQGDSSSSTKSLTGSTKLFSDAQREDLSGTSIRPKSAQLQVLESQAQHVNWDGEERIQDAVLRMLVDKYKPLRRGGSEIESADEKLKRDIPRVTERTHSGWEDVDVDKAFGRSMPTASSVAPRLEPSQTGQWATEPLLPSTKDHKPWYTTFKVPSHVEASIKFASLSTNIPTRPSTSPNGIKDDKTWRLEREAKKRTEYARRLTRARESTLDYKMGITPGMKKNVAGQCGRTNPITVKGWTSLVEDQIEVGERVLGVRSTQSKEGGKPLARAQEELNPFIGRDEYLMNRIVQRNGAAPPWVEVQTELESSIHTFRQILRQSWIRRAIRLLRSTTPLDSITLSQIKGLRDNQWFRRERIYHEMALAEVNAMVRKYNTLAPYAVRKPYYMLEVEIERLFEECTEEIFSEARNLKAPGGVEEQVEEVAYGFGDFVRETLAKFGCIKS